MDHDDEKPDPSTDLAQRFFACFAPVRSRVFAYILTLLPNWADAEEVFQETCVVLWRDFEQFDADAPGSDFFLWARRIAFHRVLAFRKKASRQRRLFSDAFVEAVAREADLRSDLLASRLGALRDCTQMLREADRQLLAARYSGPDHGQAINRLAAQQGRPADTLYKTLRRVRRSLLECINRKLRSEGVT